jgi:predicted Zn-dependent peptidase
MKQSFQRKQPQLYPVNIGILPEARRTNLKNGIPVFLIESGSEDIMRIEFTFRAGQIKESLPLQAGTTNAMLMEGSADHSSEELNSLIDYYGAFISLSAEKDGAGVVIFCLNKYTGKILELLREIIFRPSFPAKELNSLMNKRLQWFLVNREKVQNLAYDKFFESIFGGSHPYGRRISEDNFKNMLPSFLSDFHKKYYTPDNMAVIVSGKIDAATDNLLDDYFGDLETGKKDNEVFSPEITGVKDKKVRISKKGAVQCALRIGSATINKRHKDYPGLKITDMVLGGYFGSRLMKNLREDKGYTYGISSSVTSLDKSGYKVIAAEVGTKNKDKALEEIYREIRILQTRHVGKSELAAVRNYMSGEMVRMFDGPFAIAESFKSAWEFGLDNNYYYTLAEKIKTIDPDEIIELARTYYKIEDLYEIVAG